MITQCRSCGAPIVWGKTKNGKGIPLDAAPHPDGNVELHPDGRAVVNSGPLIGVPLYRSHFTTCPHAAEHRRRPAPRNR